MNISSFPFFFKLRCLHREAVLEVDAATQCHEKQLMKTLFYAHENVSAYSQYEPTGDGFEYLKAMPVMNRNDISQEPKIYRSKLHRGKVVKSTTGGSTGELVEVWRDSHYLNWNRAAKVFFDSWTGYQPGEPKVILWGARRDTHNPKLASRVARWLRNESWFDAYGINEQQVRAFFALLEHKQPKLLLAYVESLDEMVRQAMALGIPAPQVGAVMTSAGTLYPDMRERIEGFFQLKVFDRYGAREVGDMACECAAHEGLHVNPLTHHVELIKEDGTPAGPGESGEVVVTLLTNYVMPLIRYRIGDVATWADQPCSCGLPWPLLKRVEGRVTDHFVLPDGSLMHGGRLRTLLFDTNAVIKYQWVQYHQAHIVLHAVVNRACHGWEKELDWVVSRASEHLGQGVVVEWVREEVIEPGPTGKHRFTVSHVERH